MLPRPKPSRVLCCGNWKSEIRTADSYKQAWKDGLVVDTQTGDKECVGAMLQVLLRAQQPEESTQQ